MGLGDSMPIQRTMTLRQSNEPGNPIEGMLWVDTSGNNVERKQWDGSQWELDVAVGPDTPEHTVEGARWSKTDTDEVLVHDGTAWISIGVSDHANLANVTATQHHAHNSQAQFSELAYVPDTNSGVDTGELGPVVAAQVDVVMTNNQGNGKDRVANVELKYGSNVHASWYDVVISDGQTITKTAMFSGVWLADYWVDTEWTDGSDMDSIEYSFRVDPVGVPEA